MKLSNIFLPTIVGIIVYSITNKLFPEKRSNLNSKKDLRGGDRDLIRNLLLKNLVKKISQDRALKIALVSVFTTAGIQYFHQEIESLLVDDVFNQVCVKKVDGQLKIVCDLIKDHELDLDTGSLKQLIVTNNLSKEDKINLLKIKCAGKKRFLVMAMIAACASGVGGLALFLEAFYRLFQEGKISQALYEQILKRVSNRWTQVPLDHLL